MTAARAIGEDITPADVQTTGADGAKDGEEPQDDFTGLQVDGFDTEQRVRLAALPTPEGGVRPAYEAILVHTGRETESFTPTASSDGTSGEGGASAAQLLDETEETNWRANGPISGRQVTVNLAGKDHLVDRVQVSAFLRPQETSNKFGDTDTQSRFSALRQFEILTCDARGGNDAGAACANPGKNFTSVYTSPKTAASGPAAAEPRPTAPDLQLSSFDVRDTDATHVQLRVISNQCTGAPAYQGDPDADPANDSDCTSGSTQDEVVRAAELQVFSR